MNTDQPPPPESQRGIRTQHVTATVLAVVAAYLAGVRWFGGAKAEPVIDSSPAIAASAAPEQAAPEQAAEELSADQQAAKRLLGSWRDQYYGERTKTFLADGTGSMVIQLDAVGQAIYGEKLLFHLAWEIHDGILTMEFTGGEPKDAVATISKLWGTKHDQKIELLTDTDLHLRSTDSGNLYQLKRVANSE